MKLHALSVSILAVLAAAFLTAFAGTADFSGPWDTTWDSGTQSTRLVVTQKGSDIRGTYTYKGGSIVGTIEGDVATGSWSQTDGAGGTFKFNLSADGQSFKGKWRNGSKGEWTGEWNGVRR